MTHTKKHQKYSARPIRSYTYPNEADPGYFAERLLDTITAVVSGFGIVTLLMFLLTI